VGEALTTLNGGFGTTTSTSNEWLVLECNKAGKGRSILTGGTTSPIVFCSLGFAVARDLVAIVTGSLASSSSSPVTKDYSKTYLRDNGGTLGPGRRVRKEKRRKETVHSTRGPHKSWSVPMIHGVSRGQAGKVFVEAQAMHIM
ncbi:hypothetical protein HAX54_039535, partial [Datura stramonium]|nr:hypothetical protein [Datura stramonium]